MLANSRHFQFQVLATWTLGTGLFRNSAVASRAASVMFILSPFTIKSHMLCCTDTLIKEIFPISILGYWNTR